MAILLLEAIMGKHTKQQTKDTTKNSTPKQKKGFKRALKDRARCYGYESASNTENGTNTVILRTKRCFRDLVAINYRVELAEKICKTQQSVLTEDKKVTKLLHTSQGSRERKNR